MKGEYFMMKKHGLRRFFSLLLAVIMVCALLPTAALAEDTTGADETQPKAVVVDEDGKTQKKEDTPSQNPEQGTPPADGDDGDRDSDDPSQTGEVSTVDGFGVRRAPTNPNKTVGINLIVSSYGAPFINGNTGEHNVNSFKIYRAVKRGDAGSDNPSGSATGRFVGSNASGWTLYVDLVVGDYTETINTNARITNKDMSAATGYITFGASFSGTNPSIQTTLRISGGTPLPSTKPDKPSDTDVKNLLGDSAVKVHCSTPNSGHADVTYPLMDGSFTVGDVQGSSGNYTCVVTVQAAQYVTAYGNGHTLAGANESPKTITLKHNGTNWAVQSTIPIVFNVVCNTAPTAPDNDAVKALLGENAVQIICTNTQIGHGSKTFGLIDGTFTVRQDKNRCEVVINNFNPYVSKFNDAVGVPAGTHFTDNSMASQNRTKINLVWSDGKWTAADAPAKYHVLCNTAPTAPTKPNVIDTGVKVKINCTSNTDHGSETYDLTADAITDIGTPVLGDTGIYYCDVTVRSESYVTKFDRTKNATHSPASADKPVRLFYDARGGRWLAPSNDSGVIPIVFNVACTVAPPQAPTAPSHDDLSRLIGDITVNCTNDAATHTPKSQNYALIADSYTPGKVEGTADTGYTFTVTVNAEKYVTQFDTDTGATHTPKDGSQVVTLKYENDAWTVKEGKPVSFDVACVAQPTFDELKEIFNQKIFVECSTKPAHAMARYDLIAGSYTIEDFSTMTDRPTCTVVLNSRKYVASYNGTTNAVHTPENEVKRVGMILTDRGWVVAYDVLPVVFQVVCVPDAPTDRYLEDLLNQQVKVTCADPVHAPAVYELLAGSYRGSGVQPDGNGGYTYTVTIAAAEYVKKYNTERPKNHSLVKDEPTEKPVTLVWNADEREWLFANADAVPVNFNVECLYTVTYEDGVNGSVFKPLSFTDLRKGDTTPTIEDPIRVGYEFAGWNPKVQKTVTGDATYTAQWKEVDTTFTVKYNDNVKGKAFKEQVYEDLKYNEETPDFNGKPERSGYTFTGWKPVVADRVTKDVVYYAQWKSNSGKDRVPKTGDGQIVMILGSVLLFSFCGATAVCLNDRKRKQG